MRTQKLFPTGKKTSWLDARESVRDKGGLPSNVLHDEVLMSNQWNNLTEYYPAWAREVIVYPAQNKQFRVGRDVVDFFEDEKGRKWVFPASCIPGEAIGRNDIGLFVDPESVEVTGKSVVILPRSIVVLCPFIQENGQIGTVDYKTRVPLQSNGTTAPDQKRWLYRIEGSAVRPLVRDADELDGSYNRTIEAGSMHNDVLGVAYSLEDTKPKARPGI